MEMEPPRERLRGDISTDRDVTQERLRLFILELLRDPEQVRELLNFQRYVEELEDSIDPRLPRRERDAALLEAHQEVTGMPLPGANPPQTQVIPVGEHMDVSVIFSGSSCWPDRSQARLVLNDGSVVNPQTQIGIIDFYRDIRRLGRDGNLVTFSRGLITSAVGSLQLLARYYDSLGERAHVVEAFAGMSHLARLAGRFGFTVFEIDNAEQRARATNISRGVAEGVVGDNNRWRHLREKYKPAKIAYISSQDLLKKFL